MNKCSFHKFLASVIRPGCSFGFYNAPRPKNHAKTSKPISAAAGDFSPIPEELPEQPSNKLARFQKIKDITPSAEIPMGDQANDFAFIKTDFTVD
jgi:hypothetical protein